MTTPIATRVAARYMRARKTETYKRIEKLFDAVLQPLGRVNRSWLRGQESDTLAQQLSSASKQLLEELHYEADEPMVQRTLEKNKAKITNFRKMLQQWAGAPTWKELEPILESQRTKQKDVWEKAREYKEFALSLIGAFDSEHEGTVRIGPFNVALLTAGAGDWNDRMISSLHEIVKDLTRVLARVGLKELLGGTIIAYPTERLPPAALTGHSAVAAYSRGTDLLYLAVGREDDKLLGSATHEIGHRAYWKVVSPNGRAAWEAFFEGNVGSLDVGFLIQDWEAFASTDDYWAKKYGRTLFAYSEHLKKHGDEDRLKWLYLISDKFDVSDEDISGGRGGGLKKGGVYALDRLIQKKDEIKVFLHPITWYSGTKPGELFAEVFREYAVNGPSRIPEIVRDTFKRTLGSFRREAALVSAP